MNIFHNVIDTWSRFFLGSLELVNRFIADPLGSLVEFGAFLIESALLLLFITLLMTFFSGLCSTVGAFIAKLRSHPSEYSEYEVGDTRKCMLVMVGCAVGAFAVYVFHSTIFGSDRSDVEPLTYGEAAQGFADILRVFSDTMNIMLTILPFVFIYMFVDKKIKQYDQANAANQ